MSIRTSCTASAATSCIRRTRQRLARLTVLHTFSGLASTTQDNGYDGISIGDGEGAISDDDRYVALLGQTNGMGTQSLIVYNIATDTVEAQVTLASRPNNAQISRLGNYVVTVGSNTRRYPRDLSSSLVINPEGNHGDNALDGSGDEIYVTNDGPGVISSPPLSDGTAKVLLAPGSAFEYGHTSGRNIKRPGWVYLSVYDTIATIGRTGFDQIAALNTDGSGEVEVYGFANHEDNATYADQPQAVPSRDGRRVLVASEWGSGAPGTVYDYVFVVLETWSSTCHRDSGRSSLSSMRRTRRPRPAPGPGQERRDRSLAGRAAAVVFLERELVGETPEVRSRPEVHQHLGAPEPLVHERLRGP